MLKKKVPVGSKKANSRVHLAVSNNSNVDGQADRQTDGSNGRMDRRTDGWMDGRMDRQTEKTHDNNDDR